MIEFKKPSEFPKGTFYKQLADAYSFDEKCKEAWDNMWKEYDDFMFGNPGLADKYALVTVVDGEPVGHISWDPRHCPEYVEIVVR